MIKMIKITDMAKTERRFEERMRETSKRQGRWVKSWPWKAAPVFFDW